MGPGRDHGSLFVYREVQQSRNFCVFRGAVRQGTCYAGENARGRSHGMEELTRILAACSPVLALVAGWAAGQLRSVHKKDRAMENGVKMLLRAKLIDKCLHYIEKGRVPPFALETIKGLYQSYLELGDGDPSVGDLVGRVEQLEIRVG